MADKTDDLLISVSTDLTTIKRQLRQLGDSITASTSGIAKQFDGMGKSIDASMTPVQRRINEMVGLPVASKVKEWKGALADTASVLDKTGHAAGGTSASMQAMLHSVRSVGEQLALGVSPAQALTGQLSHLSFVASQPGGITAALKGVGDMALGIVTKFPWVTAAVVASGAAFVAYEAISGKTVATVDDALAEHAKTIKALRDAYGIAGDGAEDYARRSISSLESAQRRSLAALRESVAAAEKQAKAGLSDNGGYSGFGILEQLGLVGDSDLNAVKTKFAAFAEPINKLREQIRAGKPDFDAFQQSLDQIAATDPGRLRPIADQISGIIDPAARGREEIDNLSVALGQLTQQQIDTAHTAAQLANIETAAENAQGAVGALKAMLADMARLGSGEGARGDAIGGKGSLDRAQASFNDQLGLWRRFGYDNDSGIDPNKPKKVRTPRTHAVPKTAADQFDNDLQAIQDRTAALVQEQASLGLTYEAQQKRQISLQLEQTALKQVREEARKKGDADWQNAQLTPAQIKAIDEVSAAYARQADELRKAQEIQQLQRDVLKGAFDDLRSALESGKLSWKTFADTATHALDKIIDKIENDLIDSIMQANSASSGGGLGGILGAIFGGGGSSNVFPGGGSLNSTGGLYDSGGYTGPGGKKQPAGIVHKGEVVFSQDDISRLGGVSAVEAMRRGQAIGAPSMPSISAPSKTGDTHVTFAPVIDAKGAQKGAGEEITAALKKFDKEFTPRVVKALREAKQRGMA
ncbi:MULTISPECIES: hypothetical protein [unclassified Mesorhizobium]|uniref:hypothetical protein n=1 Tax=unclassified Mesorhizobium TaxID=325217 RepID=UPI001CC914DA|nr:MULTISPECIES: hypothetical protein [unclassified Mesorhizobium]MBZ9741022.1 hypothetical protein [Mesorhizobium sp. CO1-1-4]MBZ9804369.1 hypothetical protein [Mesorhizobium sp. ES1-6]